MCLPKEFAKAHGRFAKEVIDGLLSTATGGGPKPARLPKITLRDRSQLRGYAIQRILQGQPQVFATSATVNEKIREFREGLRLLDMPRYLWLEENEIEQGGQMMVEGVIHDTRLTSDRVEGSYSSSGRHVTLKGYVDRCVPKEFTLRL